MTELSLLAKATVLLAAGLIGARIVRRSRASVRHLVLVATFGALGALPLVALVMPSIAIEVPVTAGSDRGQTGPAARSVRGGVETAVKPGSDRGQTPAVSATRASSDLPASRWAMPGWPDALRMAWAVGAALILTPLGVALLRLRRIRRTALPCSQSVSDRPDGRRARRREDERGGRHPRARRRTASRMASVAAPS